VVVLVPLLVGVRSAEDTREERFATPTPSIAMKEGCQRTGRGRAQGTAPKGKIYATHGKRGEKGRPDLFLSSPGMGEKRREKSAHF